MSRVGTVIFAILYSTILLSGIYAISYDARYIAIGILLGAPIIICQWSNIILNSPRLEILERVCITIFMSYTIVALLRRVLMAPRAGLNEIYGAICAYVLIGTVFGFFYILIETLVPGAFRFENVSETRMTAAFIYFSFATLSTAGFGDIVAVAPFARSLVVIEIIIGVGYVAVLIGRLISATSFNAKAGSDADADDRHIRAKAQWELLHEPVPLQKWPAGLVTACVMINFVASVLMIHLHIPFFLDSCGTSLAVILGGFWTGAITAVLYHLAIAATYWGWDSWVWVFSSLLVAGITWFFCRRNWISLSKPVLLIIAGIVTGLLNAVWAQATIFMMHLPPYEGTQPVYSFFLKIAGNETIAALAEKMFVEIADKTISILLASVAVFLIHDLVSMYKKNSEYKT